MNKYYKNMILCSELDYHCLLCKESFEDINDVEKHVRWETHRQNIKNPIYVRIYKEFIYKIGNIYYCVICNSIVKSVQHIKTENHKEHKNKLATCKPSLGKRDTSGSIKFPKLTINRLQWHGINNGKCTLCNTTIDNVNDHINSTEHMVKIIQSEVIENEGCYYRKIDTNIHCLNCANKLCEGTMSKHSCKKDKANKEGLNNNNNTHKEHCKSPISLELLKESQNDLYEINTEDETAKCRICTIYVHPTFKDMYKHREMYHEDTMKYIEHRDHGKLRSELAAYGKENFIKLNRGGRKGYCSLCNIYISPHINVARDHVKGRLHMGHLELKGLIASKKHSLPGYRVQSLQNFLKNIFRVTSMDVFCINFSITLNIMSFMLITEVEKEKPLKRKCYCCDMIFYFYEVEEHCRTKKHKNASLASDLLLMDNEFIRIIRPGLFHCGFCNKVFPFWESMNKHVNSWDHNFARKKNELVCTIALKWYSEYENKGTVNILDNLFQ